MRRTTGPRSPRAEPAARAHVERHRRLAAAPVRVAVHVEVALRRRPGLVRLVGVHDHEERRALGAPRGRAPRWRSGRPARRTSCRGSPRRGSWRGRGRPARARVRRSSGRASGPAPASARSTPACCRRSGRRCGRSGGRCGAPARRAGEPEERVVGHVGGAVAAPAEGARERGVHVRRAATSRARRSARGGRASRGTGTSGGRRGSSCAPGRSASPRGGRSRS